MGRAPLPPALEGVVAFPRRAPPPAPPRKNGEGRSWPCPLILACCSGPHPRTPRLAVLRAVAPRLRRTLDAFVADGALDEVDHRDIDCACRDLVSRLGAAGLLDIAVADPSGDASSIQSRLVCLTRETLAWHDGLADFAFAMQGLGSGAIGLSGSPELKAAVLPKVRAGSWVAAFALSEQEAGSDVAAMSCAARAEGSDYILDGEKTWISNGGIADVYTVFARTGEAPGTRGISAFVVYADDPGLFDRRADRSDRAAPARDHPFRRLPHPRRPPARRIRRGFQDRDADARHFPRFGRRGGARFRAPRARRGARARQAAPHIRRRRSPICN